MSIHDCQHLAQEYAQWLARDITAETSGGVCILNVPFLDRHRDFLQIYVTESPDGGMRLSDDGYTINDLIIGGIDIDTPRRLEALNTILKSHSVQQDRTELYVIASHDDIPQRKHDLIQAMLAVGDLVHLAQPH